MKLLFIALMILGAVAAFGGDGPTFDKEFPKFEARQDLKIEWAVKDPIPASFWTYHVVPQAFPVTGIGTLLAQGPFTNQFPKPVAAPFTLVNASNTCTLRVAPAQGWVRYWNYFAEANHWDKSNHLHEVVQAVPNGEQAENLGLQLLKDFGISHDDLVQKSDGHLITFGEKDTRSYFDRRSGTNIDDEVIGRGVFFTRRLDGVSFAGIGLRGGCEIKFGNDAKIADFKLIWRNLKPFEHRKTASPEEIMQFIQNGRAVEMHETPVNPREVSKLTITSCVPLYMGAEGGEAQDMVYPFVQIKAVASLGTNTANMDFYCPILAVKTLK